MASSSVYASSHLDQQASWFAGYTTARHEKRVSLHFAQRDIEHFLPLYCVHRKWKDGSRITVHLPLFPSNMFVRIVRSQHGCVLSVPGALALVDGTGGCPASIPDRTIAALRSGLAEREVEPHGLLTVGQRARIRADSFAGMEGLVLRRRNGLRVVLALQQIMQSIAVRSMRRIWNRWSQWAVSAGMRGLACRGLLDGLTRQFARRNRFEWLRQFVQPGASHLQPRFI